MDNKRKQDFYTEGRRIGNTTRLIDTAIQFLFKTGSITLYTRPSYTYNRISDFIDPAATADNSAQENFMNRFIKRFNNEHPGSKVIKTLDKGCIKITIDEKA